MWALVWAGVWAHAWVVRSARSREAGMEVNDGQHDSSERNAGLTAIEGVGVGWGLGGWLGTGVGLGVGLGVGWGVGDGVLLTTVMASRAKSPV